MKISRILLTAAIFFGIWSCSNDDNDSGITVLPPRLLSDVFPENEAEMQEYLKTHFYNYEEFDSPPADFDFKIRIDTIAGENADKTPLSAQVDSSIVLRSSSEFFLTEVEEDVPHKFYYLEAREGPGASPSIADSSFVRFEGSLLNGEVFDGSTAVPVWFDLGRLQGPGQGARGFTEGIPNFSAGGQIVDNGDGTFAVEDYGIGLIILPSGLGFFNAIQPGIPQYSPLVFAVDLFTINDADHDNDGIPSILEDVDGDGYLYNDNTDSDSEQVLFVNFLDADDDGDGTPTSEEIIVDDQGNITFPDTDGDTIPDYLDSDS
ncbi:MAG: hypothetical protein AAFZ89_14535 [Bacteroidota bacterium]